MMQSGPRSAQGRPPRSIWPGAAPRLLRIKCRAAGGGDCITRRCRRHGAAGGVKGKTFTTTVLQQVQELRQKIDAIDEELIRLFCQRMEVSKAVGAYKKERSLPIFVPEREQEKLAAVANMVTPEMQPYAQALFSCLFSLSKQYQKACKDAATADK